MAYTITHTTDHGIIETQFYGEVDIEELLKAIREAAQMTVSKDCHLWLNDFTDAAVRLTTMDITRIPKLVETLSQSLKTPLWSVRRAIVTPARTNDHAFAELVNFNRGQHVKTFVTLAEARAWLVEQSGGNRVPVER